jgi:hypothetical protein
MIRCSVHQAFEVDITVGSSMADIEYALIRQ